MFYRNIKTQITLTIIFLAILLSAAFSPIPPAQTMKREGARPAPTSLEEGLSLSLALRDNRAVDWSKVF